MSSSKLWLVWLGVWSFIWCYWHATIVSHCRLETILLLVMSIRTKIIIDIFLSQIVWSFIWNDILGSSSSFNLRRLADISLSISISITWWFLTLHLLSFSKIYWAVNKRSRSSWTHLSLPSSTSLTLSLLW